MQRLMLLRTLSTENTTPTNFDELHADIDTPEAQIFNIKVDEKIRYYMKQNFNYLQNFPSSLILIKYTDYILHIFASN